jgi:hypothetical protein
VGARGSNPVGSRYPIRQALNAPLNALEILQNSKRVAISPTLRSGPPRMRPKVTDFDRICRCRIGYQPRMPAKPNIAIFDLGIGRHILTECTCLLKVPTHSVGTNTFLPGILWADSAESTWPVQIGTRFEWNSLFPGAECHHSRGSTLPQLHDPVHIFRRTPNHHDFIGFRTRRKSYTSPSFGFANSSKVNATDSIDFCHFWSHAGRPSPALIRHLDRIRTFLFEVD